MNENQENNLTIAILSETSLVKKSSESSQFFKVIPLFLASYPSEHTRELYKRSLLEFQDFWEKSGVPICKLEDLRRFHIDAWQRSIEQILSPASVCAKISALISFTRFVYENGWTTKNHGEFIKIPTLINKTGRTEALSEAQVQIILQTLYTRFVEAKKPSYKRKDYRAWLHYGVFLTFVTVGMRASELVQLRICDLRKADQLYRLHMNLKGGQEHSPLIPEYLSDFLLEFIRKCRNFSSVEDPLFTINPHVNTVIDRAYISCVISKIAKECGIETRISSHSLRATVASLLHKNNVPVGEIKDLLGHRSIITTMRYVRKTDEAKESAALKNSILSDKIALIKSKQ